MNDNVIDLEKLQSVDDFDEAIRTIYQKKAEIANSETVTHEMYIFEKDELMLRTTNRMQDFKMSPFWLINARLFFKLMLSMFDYYEKILSFNDRLCYQTENIPEIIRLPQEQKNQWDFLSSQLFPASSTASAKISLQFSIK